MRIVINQNDGVVGVDGVFRQVDVSELAGAIHAIHFDTSLGAGGVIEYDKGVTVEREVRDHEAEDAAWAAARAAGTPEAEINVPPMTKMVDVPREPEAFADFAPYQIYLDRWEAAGPPPPTAADVIDRMWRAIKAERDRRTTQGGYQAAGKWFHSDTFSRTQQLGLVLLGNNMPAGIQWKTMDASFIEMTPALAQQVFAAAAASDIAIFSAAEVHRAAMQAAADPAAYNFSGGWPAAFGE